MKKYFILFIACTIIWCCKNNTKENKTTIISEIAKPKKDSIPRKKIKVFKIPFNDSALEISSELITLTEKLNYTYNEYKQDNLKKRIDVYKFKRFAKSLAKDFENNDFKKAINFDVTFLTEKKIRKVITVEEWSFEDESLASSCFNSFNNYSEREIHFKVFNWIWIHQKNKLFLISSIHYRVNSKPMQDIKKQLTEHVLKNKSPIKFIEMDSF